MIYKFIDDNGTFVVENPQSYNLYFPLVNKKGTLLSSISPNLAGDIKKDNEHFLTPPVSITDIKTNLLCRRDFFIACDFPQKHPKKTGSKKIIRLSYPYKDKVEAGFLYHKVIKETKNLYIEILNFIPYNLDVEIMWVKIVNKSSRAMQITPTSFVPLYGRGEKNLRDHRHVSSLLNRISLNKYGIFLKPTLVFDEKGHKLNKMTYFCLGFQGCANPPIGQFPTLDYFCGQGDLIHPEAIEKNTKPLNKTQDVFNGKEAVGAFRFAKKRLKAKEEVDYFLIMGMSETSPEGNCEKIMNIFNRINSPQKIQHSLEKTKKYWLNCLSQINFDFKDKNFNNWLKWVKFQPTLRKLFGCSFLPHFDYGKGGRGWRDLWQDTLTLLLTEPEKAKKLILDSLGGLRIDGTNATIITKNGNFVSDRNNIPRVWMDHGVWPYISLRLYINKTADLDLLNTNIPYFKDHLLMRASQIDSSFSQKDYLLRTKNNKVYKGSVLEHILIAHLTSFFNVGKHNIVRLNNADWNDGLDMAAKHGESVTFSFMYAHNLRDLCFFLEKLKMKIKYVHLLEELILLLDQINDPIDYKNFKKKQEILKKYLEKTKNISGRKIKITLDDLIYDLKQKYKHYSQWLGKKEWLKSGFFNGYYDNKKKRAEGIFKKKVKMMLASQVFAIMSQIATSSQVKKTWGSIKKHLKDKNLGGFRLNTDFRLLYLDLGRAFGFSYGDKENGAFFNHMTVMLGFALYNRGFIKEGWEVIASLYKMAVNKRAEIYPMIPEYFNNQGRGLYFYLTGSASWYVYTLVEEILGIKFSLGDMILQPKLMASSFFKNSIDIELPLNNKRLKISFIKDKKTNSRLRVEKAFLGNKIIPAQDNKLFIKKETLEKIGKKIINIRVLLK